MLKLAKKFWNDEQGLELSEYAIMAGIVILVAAATIFSKLADALTNANAAAIPG